MLSRLCKLLFFGLLLFFPVVGGYYACGTDVNDVVDAQVPDGEVINEDAKADAPTSDAPVPDAPASDAPPADGSGVDLPPAEDGFIDAVTSG